MPSVFCCLNINHQHPTALTWAQPPLYLQLSHHLDRRAVKHPRETPHRDHKLARETSWGGCAIHLNTSIKIITGHKSIDNRWSVIVFPASECKDVWNELPGGAGYRKWRKSQFIPYNKRQPLFIQYRRYWSLQPADLNSKKRLWNLEYSSVVVLGEIKLFC